MSEGPLIVWFRRDLRLSDHPMLSAAVESGRALLPVFVLDPETEALGAAARFRLELALAEFSRVLQGIGSRLILRRGAALAVLQDLAVETAASGVYWQRMYDPAAQARDAAVKTALRAKGLQAQSFPGALLVEPWQIETQQGGPYRVYTPFSKAVMQRGVAAPLAAVREMVGPESWPASEALADWNLGAAMRRGGAIVASHQRVGEAAALARLAEFAQTGLEGYRRLRDFPAEVAATSGLSENLAWGEIGPRSIWAAAERAVQEGSGGAETFRKELIWREFSYHLMYHFPQILFENWRESWQEFRWRGESAQAEAWRRGMTGEPFVDAAMREVYVTGRMHNRARMIVASYLTKHLLTDWRIGQAWFAEVLTDWDLAANAMGWQWVAGSGPDAAPYFRIFNPATQAEKFDADAVYRKRWIAELSARPGREALEFFAAVPEAWRLDPKAAYPTPIVNLAQGRAEALAAYGDFKGKLTDAG